jgi:hypothetical protein
MVLKAEITSSMWLRNSPL